MKKALARLSGMRLLYILGIGFALTTAITIVVGALLTYNLINSYLQQAQAARVSRDMDLAHAFYDLKLKDISATARRLASTNSIEAAMVEAQQGHDDALRAIVEDIQNEVAVLPYGTQRFFLVTDARANTLAGQVVSNNQIQSVDRSTNWSELTLVSDTLKLRQPLAATEVVPAQELSWLGLADQAHIPLIDTPKAAAEPFDPREGTAGLALLGAAPVLSDDGELLGSIVVGHLFNRDFTLVDRIKEVAGVDTATIFLGDWRVSTNVLDEEGNRAIGTRLSEEVFDHVLTDGQEFTGPAYVVTQWFITRYRPLYDHAGNTVGMLYVGAKQLAFQQLLDSFRNRVFLIAVATIFVAILVALPIAWSISRPLAELASATTRVAEGDWGVRVYMQGYQEIRTLAGSFNTMVSTVKETQEQLIQKEKLASVGQLAAGVAHEINNPLGSILLYADLLRKETPHENQQQLEDLQMIMREATRCKTIVNDLLNFSRQNEVLARETDINGMLEEMASEAEKRDLFSNIEIVTELDPEIGTIQADPSQLQQVFVNLINNAAEAMPNGGRLTLRTRKGTTPGTIAVDVQDSGVGIPQENMGKLFTPFFTTKPIGKGTGLGLAIIYGIVKMHRGQISVQSRVGEGTTFTLSLFARPPAPPNRSIGIAEVQ